MVVRSGVGTGGWKTKSLAPRLTTAGHALRRWDESIGQVHSCPGLLPSLSGLHTQMVPSICGNSQESLKLTRELMGLGPSWVFTTHKEHRDRQSAVAEGSARRQAASTSPCHAILSWLFLPEREKEEMKSVIAYSVGCVLSLQSQLLLAESLQRARSFPMCSHSICTTTLNVGCAIKQMGKLRLREGK